MNKLWTSRKISLNQIKSLFTAHLHKIIKVDYKFDLFHQKIVVYRVQINRAHKKINFFGIYLNFIHS